MCECMSRMRMRDKVSWWDLHHMPRPSYIFPLCHMSPANDVGLKSLHHGYYFRYISKGVGKEGRSFLFVICTSFLSLTFSLFPWPFGQFHLTLYSWTLIFKGCSLYNNQSFPLLVFIFTQQLFSRNFCTIWELVKMEESELVEQSRLT